MPALHGLYRAIISTSFPWTSSQWQKLAAQFNTLCSSDVFDRLSGLLGDILRTEDASEEKLRFMQAFVARYVSRGRPLSASFIICCVMEIQWTVLAQALAPIQASSSTGNIVEAAAANNAWLSLMRQAAVNLDITEVQTLESLKSTINYAMQCFTDLLLQLEELDSDLSLDTYAWETMSESLVCTNDILRANIDLRPSAELETRFRVLCYPTRFG
jgi:phosphatidylinositol 4-kinase